jgi:TolB protein
MAEDRVGQVLTRVEQSFSPDEAFGEKLYATLAAKLDTETILSRVEQTTSPDEAFAESLYATLATRLEKGRRRRGGFFLVATLGRISEQIRGGFNAFHLQAAASVFVAALGILALILNFTPTQQERSPLAGPPTGEVGNPTSAPTFPSSAPDGCVCPTPGARQQRQSRGAVSTPPEKGQLPPSSASFQIAFAKAPDSATGHFQIYTMNLDGTNLRRVTPDDNNDYRQPSWSPDRKQLAFTRTSSQPQFQRQGEIFVSNADGSDMRPVAQGGSPEWSPDGSLIVHHRGRGVVEEGADTGPSVWTMKPDGSSPRILNDNGTDATWSPDGQYIAFGSLRQSEFPNAPQGAVNEFRMRADGSDVKQLTADPVLTCFADWSPDGKLIAYTSQLGVFTRLMLMTPDGTGHRQITHDDVSNVAPSWSPDSSLIAFEHAPRGDTFYVARPANPNGDPSSIWVMEPDGSLRRRISPVDGWSYFDPAFAP